MKLNLKSWKEFSIVGNDGLFKIYKCKGYSTKDLIAGNIPYVSRSATNNGITRYCSNQEYKYNKNCITIHHEWKNFYCSFYQDKDFITDGMIYRLENPNLNRNIGLFICSILNKTQANLKSDRCCGLKSLKIKLPVDQNNNPDWKFMEDYIRERERLSSKFN